MTNKFNEALFDAALKQAFSDLEEKEVREIEKEAEKYADCRPTAKQLREVRRAYKKANRKPCKWAKTLTRVAAVVLIVFSVSCAVIMSAPTVRAAVKDTVVEFFEKYMSFDFLGSGNSIDLGDYTLEYMPKGYELVEEYDGGVMRQYTFSDGEEEICLQVMFVDIVNVKIDNEHYTVESSTENEYIVYQLTSSSDIFPNTVIRGNANIVFTISSDISTKELHKIVDNILEN